MEKYIDFKALKEEMSRQGFRFTRRWGQNFLTSKKLLGRIVSEADVQEDDVVLEIGTGPCSLTCLLLQKKAFVVGVEIDSRLYAIGRALLEQSLPEALTQRMAWCQEDFLKSKNEVAPAILDLLGDLIARTSSKGFKLVSNLPYCIATPAIMNVIENPHPWSVLSVTTQTEVADRFVASPGTSAYGQLSVLAQALTEVSVKAKIKPASFWPRPDVDSSHLVFKPKEEKVFTDPVDYKRFKDFTRHVFAHRRKTWLKSFKISSQQTPPQEFIQRLESEGISLTQRAQQLKWEEIRRISDLFYAL